MALLKLLKTIGHFFAGIFGAASKAYEKISPEIQDALVKGSEIVSVINNHLSQTPDFVFALITEKFPDISEEKLKELLSKVSEALTLADNIHDADLSVTIQNIQAALIKSRAKDGAVWAAISSTAAKLIAVFLAPKGTKWATIETLMEYVYRAFIKK